MNITYCVLFIIAAFIVGWFFPSIISAIRKSKNKAAPPQKKFYIAHNELNKNNAYWNNYRGCSGRIIEEHPDGLLRIQLDNEFISHDGIDPNRLTHITP